MMKAIVIAAVAAAAALVPAGAQAQLATGSGMILTNRNCTQAAGTACVVGPRIYTAYSGGANATGSAAASNMNGLGASAQASVAFDGDSLPTIRVGSTAGAQTRTGGSAVGFRVYTYTGAETINLALNGALDFTFSGQQLAGDMAGQGSIYAGFTVVSVAFLNQLFNTGSTGEDIINDSFRALNCGQGVIGSASYSAQGLGAGPHTANLSLTTGCDGNPIVLRTGDQYAVFAQLQAISNRSGFADATHTFQVEYDNANTTVAATGQSVGAGFLQRAVAAASPVPEPGTWAMLLVGFGALGAALRRRAPVAALR